MVFSLRASSSPAQRIDGLEPGLLAEFDAKRPPDNFSEDRQPLLRNSVLTLSSISVAVGAAVTVGAILEPPLDQEIFSHLLIRDRPLNEIPILVQHNAGTQPGSGTFEVVGNQTMNFQDTLNRTPVRGFELDLWELEGKTVINHGGIPAPGATLKSLAQSIAPMKEWLDTPRPQGELIYIVIEDHLGPEATDAALLELSNTFGSAIYGPNEKDAFYAQHQRWPTVDEITQDGSRVMIISDNQGSHPELSFNAGEISSQFGQSYEDRTIMGGLGEQFDPEIAGQIDTDRMDLLVARGGIIKLDQISPNDPRFFRANDRYKLALHPDISLGGLWYVSAENWQEACLGMGTALATSSTSLGVLNAVASANLNEQVLNNAATAIALALDSLSVYDLQMAVPWLSRTIEGADLIKAIRTKLLQELRFRTLKAGATGTVSLAGSALSLGILFPPAFIPLAGVAISGLGIGIGATAFFSWSHQRKLLKRLDPLFQRADLAALIEKNLLRLRAEQAHCLSGEQLIDRAIQGRMMVDHLTTATNSLLASSLLVRMSSLGKYAMPVVGKVAWVAASVIATLSAAVSAALNFHRRNQQLHDISQTAIACLIPHIHKRKLSLFGQSFFASYLKKNYKDICQALDLPVKCSVRHILAALNSPDLVDIKQHYERRCALKLMNIELKKFARAHNIPANQRYSNSTVQEFAIAQVASFAHRDTLIAGAAGTLKMACAAGALSLIFPPVAGFIWIGAASSVPVGLLISKFAAVRERQKFKKSAWHVLNAAANELTPIQIKHQAELAGLLEVLRSLRSDCL